MPPGINSRYLFCQGLKDASDRQYLSEPSPFRYRQAPDSRIVTVGDGDTLFQLAEDNFSPLEDAWQYYWVIADFQPDPILDPTLKLDTGRMIVIPSVRMLIEEIKSESRRDEFSS